MPSYLYVCFLLLQYSHLSLCLCLFLNPLQYCNISVYIMLVCVLQYGARNFVFTSIGTDIAIPSCISVCTSNRKGIAIATCILYFCACVYSCAYCISNMYFCACVYSCGYCNIIVSLVFILFIWLYLLQYCSVSLCSLLPMRIL